MNPWWFLRMAQWVRHPPSARRVRAMAVVLALCLGLVGVERLWGWPDWATLSPRPHLPRALHLP